MSHDDPESPPDLAALTALMQQLEGQTNNALGAGFAELAQATQQLQQSLPELDAAPRTRVEGGLRTLHLMLAHARAQLSEVTAAHEGLMTLLAERGDIDIEAYKQHRHLAVLREGERRGQQPNVMMADIDDKYEMQDAISIDCVDRLPLCKARCCQRDYQLSEQDLDEGVVRWEYARPYLNAKDANGRCVHNADDGRCAIFGARPGGCRRFDCREDRSIWLDFDNRIPAPE